MLTDKNHSSKLLNELTALIEETKLKVVSQVNSSLTLLFWHIGNRISDHILHNKRAEYGKRIVVTVSRELVGRFGKNYEEKNLRRMIQFIEKFPDFENVVTLSRHLSWSHFLALIPLENQNARDFYGKLSYGSLIGVRELRKQISQKVYERTKNADIQLFESKILEKGVFKAKHKGQMELYLKWLDKYERQDDEKSPIGLILCAIASKEQIELLEIHKDGIMVAEYWTELPPKEILEAKLHEALIEARERIERKQIRG